MSSSNTPFTEFINYIEDISIVLELSISGMKYFSKSVERTDAYINAKQVMNSISPEKGEPLSDDEIRKRRRSAQTRRNQATKEIDKDFSTLNAHAVVSLWGALDALVHNVTINAIKDFPEIKNRVCFNNIKVPILEYEQMDEDDKLEYIEREFERNLKVDLLSGISKFELIFDSIGYKSVDKYGLVSEEIKRNLYEMQQVRNCIVHRAGIADKKLISSCPWLEIKKGEKILIASSDFQKYLKTIMDYSLSLLVRESIARNRDYVNIHNTYFHEGEGLQNGSIEEDKMGLVDEKVTK